MILASFSAVAMSFADRDLFTITSLQIQSGEKIGLLGANGTGKSTLLQLLAGNRQPDKGKVFCEQNCRYLPQLNEKNLQDKSGGEENRERLQHALADEPLLLLLDEPDNHLDLKALNFLISQLKHFTGALLLVSHNRDLLAAVCEKYWEIENGQITVFSGRLEDFFAQKQLARETRQTAYEKYSKEKKRLQQAGQKTKEKSAQVRKTPARMGNSEARLHKMGDQRAKGNLDKTASRIKTRLAKLEKVDRPEQTKALQLDLAKGLRLYNPVLVTGRSVNKSFGGKIVFAQADFTLENGAKVALLGNNGAGKTTLLNMLYQRDNQLTFVHNLKIGYLGQFFSELDLSASILDNVRRVSLYDDTFNRTILARLLFRTRDVYKLGRVLSGGELTRVSLAMLLLGNYNLLLLDEPTNHLDIYAVKAVEQALADYQGTIVFASHDRIFVEAVATEKWLLKGKKIFSGDL